VANLLAFVVVVGISIDIFILSFAICTTKFLKILLFCEKLIINKSLSAKGQKAGKSRLPGWLSKSVLLWDKISIEMKRVRTGHIGIYLTS
jgi:hypothetical protein